jgi:DivIVA domain-containing protein
MKLSPEMIREQRFKVKLSGFDKNEVVAFLMDMAEDMEMLIEENSMLKSDMETVQRRQKDWKTSSFRSNSSLTRR